MERIISRIIFCKKEARNQSFTDLESVYNEFFFVRIFCKHSLFSSSIQTLDHGKKDILNCFLVVDAI